MQTPGKGVVVPEATVRTATGDVTFPPLGVIEQRYETDPIPVEAIAERAAAAVRDLPWGAYSGTAEVAIGAGSRGIANLPALIGGVVDGVRDLGHEPFVFPAMGSHGGATAEGQRDKLATLGVTEAAIGCEIRATMDVTQVAETAERGVPVYVDGHAAAADAIVPVNRIKPHTDFSGTVESGPSKMLTIGMGKQRGAKMAHEWAVDWSFRNMIPEITTQLLDTLPIPGGVAVVEDQHDDTHLIEGIPAADLLDREAELLVLARELMPTLPFDELDVLVIDKLGKDISGQGMDTNVTGRRHFTINEPEPERPEIKRIYARSLTEKTKGNAMGVGAADFVHADLARAMDYEKSLINAITASATRAVRLPPAVETDLAGLAAALRTIGVVDPSAVRVLRVTDTMHLDRVYASPSLIDLAKDRDDLQVVSSPTAIEFENGAFVRGSPDPR